MAARIDDDFMTAEFDKSVIATARYSPHAAADGQGAWIVSGLPRRLFTRNQAITAMVLAERLGYNAGHSQRAIARELKLDRRKIKQMIDQAA